MKYVVGWHSSDLTCAHVAKIDGGTFPLDADDLFDVRLYGDPNGDDDERADYHESLAGLHRLVGRANKTAEHEGQRERAAVRAAAVVRP